MIKKLITKTVAGGVFFAISLGLGTGAILEALPPQTEEVQEETKQFSFVIKEIAGEHYFGESDNPEFPGIYFTKEYLQSDQIKVGDEVTAIFEANNTEDGLIAVMKGKN